MLQSSMLIGNTFVFFQFKGLDDIDKGTRNTVTTVLMVICGLGIGVILALRPTPWILDDVNRRVDTPRQALQRAWQLLWTPDMLMLCFTFFYTGLVLTFWSGVRKSRWMLQLT